MDKIIVLDFGSQTTQLIARRIRDFGVYSDVLPGDILFDEVPKENLKGVIFSGSPYSVYEEGAPMFDSKWLEAGLPILGICYGFQNLTRFFGGRVESLEKKEYGRSRIVYREENILFDGIPENFTSWMSHGDSIPHCCRFSPRKTHLGNPVSSGSDSLRIRNRNFKEFRIENLRRCR